MMSKCHGCPLDLPIRLENIAKYNCGRNECHLISSDMGIIRAMIAGKWECDTCAAVSCDFARFEEPCRMWQDQGGE